MKIIICYPPLNSDLGQPTLGQNRQFQYFKEPTYIYPIVPAQAATLLKRAGHQVIWFDCIAEKISREEFFETIYREAPDLIAFETKTPVIKQHWEIIDRLKEHLPKVITVLFGDHVTAMPEESFKRSEVDYILTGGDYDFLLLNLSDSLEKSEGGDYRVQEGKLEPGVWYRQNGQIKNTGSFCLDHHYLDQVPFIDRDLTKWYLYAYKNGNYKRRPGTYIMSGRDCWYHKCTFCSWPTLYPKFRTRSTGNVLDEIGELIDRYSVREVMDDTGCFPIGEWLGDFCRGMVERGFNKKIFFDCNMRFGALGTDDFAMMKKANFRLLLFGLESANQITLDKINKQLEASRIIEDCKAATSAGLFPHITIMFGYPWESYEDALRTLNLGKWLLNKGYAYTMQATVVIPYPGSLLFKECNEKGLLKSLDWDDYGMKKPVMQSSISDQEIMQMAQGMYAAVFHPEFLVRRIISIRDIEDFKYLLRAVKKVFGHIFDFRRSN